MELIDLLIEVNKENEKYFKRPFFYAKKIKREAQKILGKMVEVYLFGSIVKGNYTPASDIDVLVVGPEVKGKERGRVRARLKKAVDFFSPFEIHLVTKDQFENWYKRFIKQDLEKSLDNIKKSLIMEINCLWSPWF